MGRVRSSRTCYIEGRFPLRACLRRREPRQRECGWRELQARTRRRSRYSPACCPARSKRPGTPKSDASPFQRSRLCLWKGRDSAATLRIVTSGRASGVYLIADTNSARGSAESAGGAGQMLTARSAIRWSPAATRYPCLILGIRAKCHESDRSEPA